MTFLWAKLKKSPLSRNLPHPFTCLYKGFLSLLTTFLDDKNFYIFLIVMLQSPIIFFIQVFFIALVLIWVQGSFKNGILYGSECCWKKMGLDLKDYFLTAIWRFMDLGGSSDWCKKSYICLQWRQVISHFFIVLIPQANTATKILLFSRKKMCVSSDLKRKIQSPKY